MTTPSARSAPTIRSLSRARSGAVIRVAVSDSAASTSARLVSDLEPGSATVAASGPSPAGADQLDGTAALTGAGRERRCNGRDRACRQSAACRGCRRNPVQTGDMCGRYVNVAASSDLLDEFDAEEAVGADPGASWNIAPTDAVRVVLERAPKDAPPTQTVRQLRTVRWGLVPSWSKDPQRRRADDQRPHRDRDRQARVRKAAARRRCLVPALGYYEWQQTPTGKVPHFLHDPDGRLLAMAGLYELWRDPARADDDDERWVWTCTIITQQATDLLGEIHDRNPVVVPRELWSQLAGLHQRRRRGGRPAARADARGPVGALRGRRGGRQRAQQRTGAHPARGRSA